MTTTEIRPALPLSDLPASVHAALWALRQPFPMHAVRIRPGAAEPDTLNARALVYAEWWTAYVPRLNQVLGPHAWSIGLSGWSSAKVFARLTAFGGLIDHTASGEGEPGDSYEGTSAEAQAKKRVCAEALGLGHYLYFLPPIYGRVEHRGGSPVFTRVEQERIIRTLYAAIPSFWPRLWGADVPPPVLDVNNALATAPTIADEAQLGYLLLLAQGHSNRRRVATLGQLAGVADLATLADTAALRASGLCAERAALLIDALRE